MDPLKLLFIHLTLVLGLLACRAPASDGLKLMLAGSGPTRWYGWGIHSNAEGKIAMIGVESEAYQKLVADESVTKIKAMRSKRA